MVSGLFTSGPECAFLVLSGPLSFRVRADRRREHIPPLEGAFRMKPYRPPSDANPIREKFALARKELSSSLIERDEEVDLGIERGVGQHPVSEDQQRRQQQDRN